MDAAPPHVHAAATAAAPFSEDTTPGDSPRSGDSAESTSFRCAICLVRRQPPKTLMLRFALCFSRTTQVDAPWHGGWSGGNMMSLVLSRGFCSTVTAALR